MHYYGIVLAIFPDCKFVTHICAINNSCFIFYCCNNNRSPHIEMYNLSLKVATTEIGYPVLGTIVAIAMFFLK